MKEPLSRLLIGLRLRPRGLSSVGLRLCGWVFPKFRSDLRVFALQYISPSQNSKLSSLQGLWPRKPCKLVNVDGSGPDQVLEARGDEEIAVFADDPDVPSPEVL